MLAMPADSFADMLERLFAEYELRHSLMVIRAVVTRCQDELAGQPSPAAELELLDRLARHRLNELPPTRRPA